MTMRRVLRMPIRSNQKMVVFTEKELVTNLIDEEAQSTGVNTSKVIENNLLSIMLTENNNMRYWLESLYKNEITINRFMEALFGLIADDWTNTMRTKSNYAIVTIAKKMAEGQRPYFDLYHSEYNTNYLISQLDSLATILSNMVLEEEQTGILLLEILGSKDITKNLAFSNLLQNTNRKYYPPEGLQQIADHTIFLMKKINEKKENISFDELYQLVIDSWQYTYEFSCTYKLLLELSKLQKNYDIRWRYDLRKSINQASRYWF
jgi:hypothetical protein